MEVMGDHPADRISELPDILLLHILSSLPTKLVFSTSILSKRWRYVCTSIPILDFLDWRGWVSKTSKTQDDWILKREKFMNFVDRLVLLSPPLHNQLYDDDVVISPINIQKFCLRINHYFDNSRVCEWISTLTTTRKIKDLSLSVDIRDFVFPPCFFTCETLTTLELEGQDFCQLPESISLPSLKILRLMSVQFRSKELILQFLSNSPVLEELVLSKCSWMGGEPNIYISSPSLKRLNINNGSFQVYYDCGIKIHAPNLQSLTFMDSVFKEFVLLHSFSSLVDADIEFWYRYHEPRHEMRLSASKLLAGLSNVKQLKISHQTVTYLADDSLPNLPSFSNLIHLEVTATKFYFTQSWLNLLGFLSITPNLESIVFSEGFSQSLSSSELSELIQPINFVPECMLLHLKVVEIQEFDGQGKDLQVISFFLKNARVLERMTIICSYPSTRNKVMELVEYSRGLSSCEVQIL